MAITYDATNNVITITGYTSSVPANFTDLYNADKAGSLQLLPPTAAALDLSLSRQVRPADDKALKLNLIITGFSVAGTVTLTGLDKDGGAQTESISITGNGTFASTKWFKSIDAGGVDCTGTYTIEVTQSRWGVIWKTAINQFLFDAKIQIGDGSTITWFADVEKQVTFNNGIATYRTSVVLIKTNGNFRLGQLIDINSKQSGRGVALFTLSTTENYLIQGEANSNAKIYSSLVASQYGYLQELYNIYGTIWHTNFYYVFLWNFNGEIEDVILQGGDYGFINPTGTLNNIEVGGTTFAIYARTDTPATFKNTKSKNNLYDFYFESRTIDAYLINVESDDWVFAWYSSPAAKWIRQYEFDVHVQDKNGNPLSGVSVVAEYVSPYGTAFTQTTDANGDIATQTVDHGWFEQATGSTENLKTPLKVTYSKPGFQTVVKYYPLTEKTKDRVVLQRAVDIILVDEHPALNRDEDNPESEEYTSL